MAATGGGAPIAPQSAATTPKGIPTAVPFGGAPTTGALFYTTNDKKHFCTASVVDSATGNLVLTAAHCVYSIAGGYVKNIEYVPGYDDGKDPYGAWAVATITVASEWEKSQDPDYDFAFLTVSQGSGQLLLQSRTGGLGLGAHIPYTENGVEVIGYNDTDSGPVRCTVKSFEFRTNQREFYCHGYWDGTSGGPWILHYNNYNGTGTVIGVIGGYRMGGDYEWASYSAYFGSDVESLYKQAQAAAEAAVTAVAVTRAPRL